MGEREGGRKRDGGVREKSGWRGSREGERGKGECVGVNVESDCI